VRLFAALVPPGRVLDELDEHLAPFRERWPGLRWARHELMHVTLAFYGEVDERKADRLLPRLERAAGRYPPVGLSFAGAGAFPSGGAHARVLWTGLYGDRRTLAALAATASAAGRRVGLPLGEPRPYRPHLTLARCRTATDLRPLLEELASFAGSPWTADALHLVRSHLGAAVRYETLTTWPLKGTAKGQ
jgi:2'-5' RNA ligase